MISLGASGITSGGVVTQSFADLKIIQSGLNPGNNEPGAEMAGSMRCIAYNSNEDM